MTTDLERRLRDTLERDASLAPRVQRAPERLRRRVRRHQAGIAAATAVGLVAVVALTFAGIQAFDGDDRFAPTPAGQLERPVFQRTTTIEGFTVTSPSDWAVVDYWPVMGRADALTEGVERGQSVPGSEWYPGAAGVPVLQLTNYDPGLGAPICGSPTGENPFPADGVGLYVGFVGTYYTATDRGGTELGAGFEAWPNVVSVEPTSCGGGTELRFGIRRGDRLLPYLMWYGAGPEASAEDRARLDAIVDAFAVDADQPVVPTPVVDSPGFVLWGGTNADGSTWTIEARASEQNVDLMLAIRGTDGVYGGGGYADFDVPPRDVDGGSMGVVTESAERVEFRRSDGGQETLLAQLTDLPASLGYGADAYWFPSDPATQVGPAGGDVVAIMPGSGLSIDPATVPGGVVIDRAVLGGGVHPTAGSWQVEVTLTDQGVDGGPVPELGFMFADHGGGSGSIGPLDGAVIGELSWGWTRREGDDIPVHLDGLVTPDAARVVYVPAGSGEDVEGLLFPIPERFIGPAQAFLVLIDGGGRSAKGELIAYDAQGNELERVTTGDTEEPGGVTPEIDAVIEDLRAVRNAIASDDLRTMDAAVLNRRTGVDVTLGSEPQEGTVVVIIEDEEHAVLMGVVPDGQVLCIGLEVGWSYRYGIGTATTYEGCGGGWDGYMLPPDA